MCADKLRYVSAAVSLETAYETVCFLEPDMSGYTAVATSDHQKGAIDDTISFRRGDVVRNITCLEGRWWTGIAGGEEGFFDKECVMLDILNYPETQIRNMNLLGKDLNMPYKLKHGKYSFEFAGEGARNFDNTLESPRWKGKSICGAAANAFWNRAMMHYKESSASMVHTAQSEIKAGRNLVYAVYENKQFSALIELTVKKIVGNNCHFLDGSAINLNDGLIKYIVLA